MPRKTATFMPSRSWAITAPGCTATCRVSGTAHAAGVLRRGRLPTPPATTSGGLLHRHRCWLSPTRRSAATTGLVPGFEAPVNLMRHQRNRSLELLSRASRSPGRAEGQAPGVPLPRPSATPTSPSRRADGRLSDGIKRLGEPPVPVDRASRAAARARRRRQVRPPSTRSWTHWEADRLPTARGRRAPDLIETSDRL
jgi:hypothetical protein